MRFIKEILLILILVLAISTLDYNTSNSLYVKKGFPTPIEFFKKKKKKKDFKNQRKLWIENMHKSAPDVDWSQIDRVNRKNNTDRISILRESLLDENQIS